jgi:hypothetical protein
VKVLSGDLLLCRSKAGFAGRMIRFGALLRGQSEEWNHVAVVHHRDDAGTVWAIEGRPGGVGWVDARKYLTDPMTITNVGQPKLDGQRSIVCAGAVSLLGVAYDWKAIGMDAASAARIDLAWKIHDPTGVPAHVVCSSLADWLYQKAGLINPSRMPSALTTPADWADLIIRQRWQNDEPYAS